MDRRQFLQAVAGCVALGSFLPVFNFALADEPKSAALLQTLPADGAWVTFNVNAKVNGQEFVLTGTVRSVGQAFHDGKQCRFIEYEQTADTPSPGDIPQLGNLTWRLLVPEEEFGEGKDPLGKAVKKWVTIGKNEPEVVESIEQKDPIFATLFQGPKQNLKTEDTKEKVSWQQGDLECSVITGRNELEFGVAKLNLTHRVFRHRDVPFGIAGVQQELKVSFGGQEHKASIRASLRDHGKEAKSKLSDLVP